MWTEVLPKHRAAGIGDEDTLLCFGPSDNAIIIKHNKLKKKQLSFTHWRKLSSFYYTLNKSRYASCWPSVVMAQGGEQNQYFPSSPSCRQGFSRSLPFCHKHGQMFSLWQHHLEELKKGTGGCLAKQTCSCLSKNCPNGLNCNPLQTYMSFTQKEKTFST